MSDNDQVKNSETPHNHETQDDKKNAGFESCNVKHSFCTVGLGDCKMRKGHADWGQSHVCNKCGKDF